MCGYPPFYHENELCLFEIIMQGDYSFDERFWSEVSGGCMAVIREMLVVDPVARYTTQQVLQHTWITGAATLPTVNLSKSISMNLKKTVLREDAGVPAKTAAPVPPTAAVARPQAATSVTATRAQPRTPQAAAPRTPTSARGRPPAASVGRRTSSAHSTPSASSNATRRPSSATHHLQQRLGPGSAYMDRLHSDLHEMLHLVPTEKRTAV